MFKAAADLATNNFDSMSITLQITYGMIHKSKTNTIGN